MLPDAQRCVEPRRCITQDSESYTLPIELLQPRIAQHKLDHDDDDADDADADDDDDDGGGDVAAAADDDEYCNCCHSGIAATLRKHFVCWLLDVHANNKLCVRDGCTLTTVPAATL